MKTARLKRIEDHDLGDGRAIITKLGRCYTFTRTNIDGEPEIWTGLTKRKAYEMLDKTLKRDVLELD